MSQENRASVPNLWPTDKIKVSVLSPVAILKMQAGHLAGVTHDLLLGEVRTTDILNKDRQLTGVEHTLDIVAPALDGYRRRILRASHAPEEVYPVRIIPELSGLPQEPAVNQDDFISKLESIFQSGAMLTMIHSLIARSNDAHPLDEAA